VAKLSETRKALGRYLTQPAARLVARTSITPDAITWFGFFLIVGAAVLIAGGHLLIAGFLVLAAGFFDILDGALARYTNRTTRFGAILDSTLDRLSEAVLLFGILVLYAGRQSPAVVLLVFAALLASLLVSYIRARAEALGIECQVGLFTRAERVIVMALGLFLNQVAAALVIVAALSFITVGQRLVHVWRETRGG
jgi:CDP-diacylglycerol--glycerol-3-phosphate 3-phosphatidyltransferase